MLTHEMEMESRFEIENEIEMEVSISSTLSITFARACTFPKHKNIDVPMQVFSPLAQERAVHSTHVYFKRDKIQLARMARYTLQEAAALPGI